MPIVIEEVPEGLLDLVETSLANLPPALDGAVGAEGSEIYRPLPVFGATLRAIVSQERGTPLSLERVSWRVLVDEGVTLSLAEIGAIDGEPQMTGLWRGAVADRLAEATVAAEEALDGERLYRARIIALPEIGLEALWLHADYENDLVIRLQEQADPETLKAFSTEARRRAAGADGRDGEILGA